MVLLWLKVLQFYMKVTNSLFSLIPLLLIAVVSTVSAQEKVGNVDALLAQVDSWELPDREMVLASLGESSQVSSGEWRGEEHVSFGSELTTFSVLSIPEGNELTWITTREFGSEKFAVERKLPDGRFAIITMIDAKGSSEDISVYRFLDMRSDGSPQVYRLRQFDQNGTIHTTNPLEVFPATEQMVVLRPTVRNGKIELPLESRIVKVNVWNRQGELVLTMEAWDEGIQEIEVSGWKTGEYAMEIQMESGSRSAIVSVP